jgi:hypothetical protein
MEQHEGFIDWTLIVITLASGIFDGVKSTFGFRKK